MNQEAKNHLDMYWIEDMFIYSFRYTLGRMSYAPSVCMDFLEPLIPYISSHTLEIMSNEIGECALGASQSPDEWNRFKNKLDGELAKRE